MVNTTGEDRNLSGFDVLRGAAICLVIFAHFFGAYIPAAVETLCAHGGVMLFFFLSGFLIDRTLAQDSNVIRYIVRRGMRILPMYWVTVLLIAATDSKWTGQDIAANLIFSSTFSSQMSGVFWTLYVECLFYVFAPLAILSGSVGLIIAPFLVIARFAYGLSFGIPASPMWFYLVYCFLGLQIGATWRGVVDSRVTLLSAILISASAWLLVAWWLGVLSAACAIAICVTLRINPRVAFLSFLGQVSYSWYLLHSIFGYTFGWAVVAYFHVHAVVGLSAGVAITLLASALTHKFIELPGIAFSKTTARWLTQKSAPPISLPSKL